MGERRKGRREIPQDSARILVGHGVADAAVFNLYDVSNHAPMLQEPLLVLMDKGCEVGFHLVPDGRRHQPIIRVKNT